MSGLAVQFLDQGLHRVIFDAMPMPVFVVDDDVSILEYNSAAAALLGGNKQSVLRRKSGDILNCIHATEAQGGCGHSKSCGDCVVRQSVKKAARGATVTREWGDLELLVDGKVRKTNVRVSTRPLMFDRHSFVLLVLEGLEECGPILVRPRARKSKSAA